MIAGHAALLAWKSGRPVKLIYDRAEDMVATTKRHPSRTRHRTARRRRTAGCVAMDIDFVIDGGAYCTLSPVVLSRGTIHAAGPVLLPERARARPRGRDQRAAARRVPRLRRAAEPVRARAAHGPRRGRRRPRAGGVPPPQLHPARPDERGRPGHARAGRHGRRCSIARSTLSDYHAKRARFDARTAQARCKKGIGFAAFMHGAGFTGSGEDHLASVVDGRRRRRRPRARADREHRDRPGHEHDLRADRRRRARARRRRDRGRAARHRGRAQQRADGRVAHLHGRRQAGRDGGARRCSARWSTPGCSATPYTPRRFQPACRAYIAQHRAAAAPRAQYEPPPGMRWDDERYQGDAYGTYAWAVYVAEVTVDTDHVRDARRRFRRACRKSGR